MGSIVMDRSGEMEVFLRVTEKGGFAAAARSLDLTPSAVSKLIGRLEQRLGARLLQRTTRALTLTDEGIAYQQAARRVLESLNDADEAVSGGVIKGHLRINATVAFGRMHLAPVLVRFLAAWPSLSIALSLNDDVVDLLAERADIAIRSGTLADSSLRARQLTTSRRVICAAPAYLARRGTPKVPGDLAQHDCVQMTSRTVQAGWPFLQKKRAAGKREASLGSGSLTAGAGAEMVQAVSGPLQVNNGDVLRDMALQGLGLVRIGRFHVQDDIQHGRLVPVLENFYPDEMECINAVYMGAGRVPARVRVLIDFLAGNLPAVLA